jgi:hypothetical protein
VPREGAIIFRDLVGKLDVTVNRDANRTRSFQGQDQSSKLAKRSFSVVIGRYQCARLPISENVELAKAQRSTAMCTRLEPFTVMVSRLHGADLGIPGHGFCQLPPPTSTNGQSS